jgi:hypothetical protein
MNNILKSIFLIKAFKALSQLTKDDWFKILKYPFIALIPLILFTITGTIGMLGFSFIMWDWPDEFYFPFIIEEMRSIDRFVLLFGILISFGIGIDDLME